MEKILEKPWARRTRTRIGLRTHFISEPTEEEVEEAYINEEYSNVSAEDIRQALDSGEEVRSNVLRLRHDVLSDHGYS